MKCGSTVCFPTNECHYRLARSGLYDFLFNATCCTYVAPTNITTINVYHAHNFAFKWQKCPSNYLQLNMTQVCFANLSGGGRGMGVHYFAQSITFHSMSGMMLPCVNGVGFMRILQRKLVYQLWYYVLCRQFDKESDSLWLGSSYHQFT